MKTLISALALVALTSATPTSALAQSDRYSQVVNGVAGMVSDANAQQLASQYGLQILNVTWEDTGRFQGSSVGPNISDVTIEVVQGQGDQRRMALMPVIRFPNFEDKTADVKLDRFFLRVGNESRRGQPSVISLRELLADPMRYLSFPGKGHVKGGSLLAPRDTHALVSAQAAFLPVPQGGKATFHPVIFNYQSTAKNPAVLTLLVTRQGTSVTVVDNARDSLGGSWGQRLFFNEAGERAPLTAERLSDVQASGVTSNGESAASLGDDANLLMLVQVPLRYREPPRRSGWFGGGMAAPTTAMAESKSAAMDRDDVEVAVLGHGELQGPFTELDGLTIERDPRFPVRVTVQFYQATSSAQITSATMHRLAQQISRVYDKGDAIGSLVVPSPNDLRRTTNWDGVGPAPKDLSFWDFPGLLERWTKGGTPAPETQTIGVK